MTTAGYVFTGLNIVLSLVFALIFSSVAQQRIDRQKRIDTIVKSAEEIEATIPVLDRERSRLVDDLIRAQADVSNETRVGTTTLLEYDARISELNEAFNSETTQAELHKNSLTQVQAEVDARAAEIKDLQNTIAEETAKSETLAKEIAGLQTELSTAERGIEKYKSEVLRDYQRVVQQEAGARPAGRIANLTR